MNIKAQNANGLTLIEWLCAAAIIDVKSVTQGHIDAWKAGEDPSEHRAHVAAAQVSDGISRGIH